MGGGSLLVSKSLHTPTSVIRADLQRRRSGYYSLLSSQERRCICHFGMQEVVYICVQGVILFYRIPSLLRYYHPDGAFVSYPD